MQQAAIKPRHALRFAEIPAATHTVLVPTRHVEAACTVYSPLAGHAGAPAYVNFHGGGFVVGCPEQDDPWCRYLAAKAGVAVINVDYALAPQHRFPVAVEQAYDVVKWAAAPERPWDGTRLCVGGQSAGGALTAAAQCDWP